MKAIKNQVTRLCCVFLILVCIFWAGCGKQTINGVALPEFYGLFAIDGGKLVQVKQGDFPNFSGDVTFLLFDKSVAFGADTTFYSIGFDTEPHPADDGSFSWPKFMQAADAYQSASQAALTGIPQGARPIETLKKPVPNKNEMLQFVPATPLKPGLYQLGNVAKFWVAREKYQSTVELNARQALQAEHWVEASRFATIALIVGLSNPSQANEFTQIKFGALIKGANKAVEQENFDLAESLAKRGNDLQPPTDFASKFRQLVDTEIPYHKAIKIAATANKNEEWDVVVQAGEMALRLKPGDPKAKEILSACPKVLLPEREKFNVPYGSLKTYNLQFTSDSKKVIANLQGVASSGYPYPAKIHAWNVDTRSEIDVPGSDLNLLTDNGVVQSLVCITPGGESMLKTPRDELPYFENLFNTNKEHRIISNGLTPTYFSEDGSIYLTPITYTQKRDIIKYGLLSIAQELGLIDQGFGSGGVKACVFISDAKTLKLLTLIGFPDTYEFLNAIANNKLVILLEDFSFNAGEQKPFRLSAWDIQSHKLLAVVKESGSDFSLWGFAPDGKRVIVWKGGKFWHWNWETQTFESPVELPTQGNHITVFSPNHKYVADRSTSDPYIRIWEFETGKVLCKFKEASGVSVNGMAFSPDGAYLAVSLERNTDFLSLWKIPDDLKPSISKKLIFAVATPKEELATTSSNTANQQDSAQPASQTKTAQQTANNDISQTPFQKLTATVPNARLFAHHTREYSFAYDKVWDAVSSLLADQKDKIIQSDKNSGGLITDMTRHGIIGFPSYNKYCLLVEKESDASTKVTLKLLLYYMDFNGAHGPRNTLQPQNKDFTNGKAEGFLDKVGERLQKGK